MAILPPPSEAERYRWYPVVKVFVQSHQVRLLRRTLHQKVEVLGAHSIRSLDIQYLRRGRCLESIKPTVPTHVDEAVVANLVDAPQYFSVEELDLRMGLEVLDVFDLHEQAGHPLHESL